MKNGLLLLLLLPVLAFAQPYGNEWIDFNKEYFKIKLAEDGIYRIDYTSLEAAGFPVNTVDPRRIQLFHRGQEMAIYIEGEGDAVFDPGDYIEFYGQRNDGTLDEELYVNPPAQPHKYYNLYADSTAYFLTYYLIAQNGKRLSAATPYTGVAKDTYYFAEVLRVFDDEYSKGLTISSYTNLTQFDIGEGFTGPRFTETTNPVFDINLTGIDLPVTAAANPELELLITGRNNTTHDFEVFVGPDVLGLTSIGTFNFSSYTTLKINQAIPWAAVGGGGTMMVRVQILDNAGTQSNISVAYARLTYARQTDMAGRNFRQFNLQVKASGGDVVEILDTPAGARIYDITDPLNVAPVIDTDVNPSTITCGFPDATAPRTLAVGQPTAAFKISRVNFRQFTPAEYNYLIISNKLLMQAAGNATDAVRAYAAYRASAAGGSYDTLVVETGQLYNQFSYGEVTPLAIYRFMKYMLAGGNPEYLFLIGKALEVSTKYHRKDPSLFTYHDLVPTAGSPGADQPFASGLSGDAIAGWVPVGRLSVSSPQEVINYLNKVVEIESTPYAALWRKNLLHLSGGNSLTELELFKSYVDGFKAVAEDVYLGGKVSTVSKATTATVEFINVSGEVNQGLNLITFFGHSAPNVTDIDIGFVSDPVNGYNNKGKYPMIVMNGCNAGNIYEDTYIFGEDWMATADKGATAVIAHTSFGYAFTLKLWSDLFYTVAYADTSFIEKTVGNILLEVGKRVLDFTGPNPPYIYLTQIQQMGLQGDPALKVFGTKLPDYEINLNNIGPVSLTERGITSEADSFALAIGVRNFGAYIPQNLEVAVRRTLQNGTVVDYDTVAYAPVSYQDTLLYVIDNNLANNAGINSFEITLDPAGKIPEHSELNNLVYYNLPVPLSGTINLAPLNYAIQYSATVDLLTQAGDPLAQARDYIFEFDSTLLFTSPYKKTATLNGKQLAAWPGVDILTADSLPYYWRTRYAQLKPNEADIWADNTFTYIAGGSEGWAQVAYQQMKKNTLNGLKANEAARSFDFLQTTLPIEVVAHGANSADYTYQDTELIIDGLPFIYPTTYTLCANDKLLLVAFNQETAAPYAPVIGNQVQPWTCGRSPQVINVYPAGKTLDEIIDAIPTGDKVLLFTTGSFDFNTLTSTTMAKLENLGADAAVLAAKLPAAPYIMVGFKGAGSANSAAEIVGDTTETISYTGNITGVYASGAMTSPAIGPALAWDKLTLAVKKTGAADVFGVDVIGKDFAGNETILFAGVQVPELLLSGVDATQYPYLKLQLRVADTVNRTAPQLRKWLVNYVPPAEGYVTFLGNSAGNGLAVTLQEGQVLSTQLGYVNITARDFTDSLLVRYTVFNQDQRQAEEGTMNIAPPAPGDTTFFTLDIPTRGRVGLNDLSVAVNTLIIPEQLYENNNLTLANYLTVTRDAANPLLEVSFDGEYIFDGDIVSPNPNIRIVIRDENPYLLKTDTTGIDIFLTRPCDGCTAERVSLAGAEVTWTPQTNEQPFRIDFTPQNLEDGVYKLSVQAEDASGNKSGVEPYVINFEVVNKSTITNFYPYPNPFATRVKFIFTLTGSEIPDQILIRIFTVSGRVVREITQDELGPLRIGNNVTDYAWDGRDEFGDQLANGVYLYKVYIRINGRQVELRESAGDRGFTKGYGKLYLLR